MQHAPRESGGTLPPDLHTRLLDAARGLPPDADLQRTLAHLLHSLGAGTSLARLLLLDATPGGKVLAAFPGPVLRLDDHAHLASLLREVQDGAAIARVLPTGDDGDVAMVAVPLVVDDETVGALVGQARPGAELGEGDETVVEAMSALVTPLLLAERQLEHVRELDRLRTDFISRVSHELRTPLTIITGFAGTLGAHEETLSAEQRHGMLDRIVTAAVRLEHLVEDVLSLASVEAGLAEPDAVTVPVRDIVDLTVHDANGAERVTIRGGERLRVHTDPEIARHVLGPVVENALQHGAEVEVEVAAVGDAIRITVSDDGPGIPPGLGSRIFDRFVRGDDRTPGMGLGLAIARRMAETIRARISVREIPEGACFVVDLPSLD